MFTAPRIGVLALAACLAGCSGKPATGALLVVVNLEPGLISRCVKVSATDGTNSKQTQPIALAGKTSPLHVAIYGEGLVQPVTVQALGFTDEACTLLTPGETSETAEGNFTAPASSVTLTLRANATSMNDGGSDAGRDGGVDAGADAGTDAGLDAGVDRDGDGYPVPADCDDTNPDIHPTALESCTNDADDDCDSLTDCQAPECLGFVCAGGGQCIGTTCIGLTEVSCTDGRDNNNNMLADCLDRVGCPVGTLCSDSNGCTTGDRCVADGGCEKTTDVMCVAPPADAACHLPAGACLPDAGAVCQYTPLSGTPCSDGLNCTSEICASGTCASTAVTCPAPSNVCLETAGTCTEPVGTCVHLPRPTGTGTCTDGQNCTINDRCDGDGGCAGTTVSCPPPSQCQTASTACDLDGGCLYNSRNTLPCDAGTAGTCMGSTCMANPPALFPTPPSNFTEAQLPTDGGAVLSVTTARVLDTDGPGITGGAMPPYTIITPGGVPTLLVKLDALNIASGQTLVILGNRPLILAVVGNVLIDGTIRASNAGAPAGCGVGGAGGAVTGLGGGGGGGFGTAGAVGGNRSTGGGGAPGAVNGFPALIPLRGGCVGGNGSGFTGISGLGGPGGGAIQITASGSITVTSNGVITAPGLGGMGATANGASGGGGGSGGAILLEAATINLNSSSWLSANGGAGGGGEDSNGGNGNPGNETSAVAATGGTAQNNAGRGGNGGAGTTAPQAGAPSAASNDGAGGGGGAVGRIRLNASASCMVDMAAGRSPAYTSTGCP